MDEYSYKGAMRAFEQEKSLLKRELSRINELLAPLQEQEKKIKDRLLGTMPRDLELIHKTFITNMGFKVHTSNSRDGIGRDFTRWHLTVQGYNPSYDRKPEEGYAGCWLEENGFSRQNVYAAIAEAVLNEGKDFLKRNKLTPR